MRGVFDYIVKPFGDRYKNKVQVEKGKDLILNTEVFNHQYINRVGIVETAPAFADTPIKSGDEVVIHHNVFRRWHDIKGVEKNSRAFIDEDTYLVQPDQIFLYRAPGGEWQSPPGYCFVQPVKNDDRFSMDTERPLVGVVKYSDGGFEIGSTVGFSPGDEFEFVIEEERLYRIMSKFINIQYEYQGDEEAYNPSWAQSG